MHGAKEYVQQSYLREVKEGLCQFKSTDANARVGWIESMRKKKYVR